MKNRILNDIKKYKGLLTYKRLLAILIVRASYGDGCYWITKDFERIESIREYDQAFIILSRLARLEPDDA